MTTLLFALLAGIEGLVVLLMLLIAAIAGPPLYFLGQLGKFLGSLRKRLL
jgi:hypothetical protein